MDLVKLADYIKWREDMRSGDCLLWQSASVLGWLIREFSGAYVNHASLIVRPPEYLGMKDRRFQLEALGHGIVLRLVSERLSGHRGKVWWYPLKDEYDAPLIRRGVVAWAALHVGTSYDFHSLFKNVLGRVSANAKRFFCSEYCFMAWQAGGIPLTGKAPRPGDIPGLGIFKEPRRVL